MELACVYGGIHSEVVGAGAERHDDLFQGRVAGPLADAVDGALQGFVALMELNGFGDIPILGTLEQRPVMEPESLPPRRPNQSVTGPVPFAADAQQRS